MKENLPRILCLLHLPPPVHGASVIGDAIRGSRFLNERFKCTYINLSTSREIGMINRFTPAKIFSFLRLLYTVMTRLLKRRYSFCYITLNTTGSGFYKDLAILTLVRLFHQKSLFHFHNKGISKYHDQYIHDLLYKAAFNHSSCILVSELLYSDVSKYFAREHVFICPNGIPGTMTVIPKCDHPGMVEILYFSHMKNSKGVIDLIDACRLLMQDGFRFHCTFAGTWSDITPEVFADEIHNRHLGAFVTAVGPKYDTDKEKLYEEADIFVFPTHDDIFGLVLLEAMAHSLPVIATLEGGIPDVVADNVTGLLYQKGDIVMLTDCIRRLILDENLRRNLGNAGYDRYRERFTLQKFEENLTRIFSHFLAEIEK